jgi:hypothetical protein
VGLPKTGQNLEEMLYPVLPSGGWIVDARVGILDIEKELIIQIPQTLNTTPGTLALTS